MPDVHKEAPRNVSRPSSRKTRWARSVALLGILVVAGWLRLGFVANTPVIQPIRADARQYVAYARNLGEHGVFSADEAPPIRSDSYRSPGYPVLLSLVMALHQRWYVAVLCYQAIIATATVLVTFSIAKSFLPEPAAWCASIMTAISPHLVAMSVYLLTETLFCFVLLVSLKLFLVAHKRKSCLWFAGSGISFGVTYLANEACLFLPLLLMLARTLVCQKHVELRSWSDRAILRTALPFLFAFAIFPSCWTIRNAITDTNPERAARRRAIATISHGSYPDYIYESAEYRFYPYREDPEQPAYGQSFGNFWPVFWRRVSERPVRYLLWYAIEKPFTYFWGWSILQGQGDVFVYSVRTSLYHESAAANALRLVMKYTHSLTVVSAMVGVLCVLCGKTRSALSGDAIPPIVITVCLGYFTVLYGCIFAGWPRYAIPLRPELYLAAAYGLSYAYFTISRACRPVVLAKLRSREQRSQ